MRARLRLPAPALDELAAGVWPRYQVPRNPPQELSGPPALTAPRRRRRQPMARIDESRPFIAVNIAVLTVSDTRTPANDTSGDALVGPHRGRRPPPRRPRHREGRRGGDRRPPQGLDRRSGGRRGDHHRRHRRHRPRRYAGSVRAGAGEADRGLRRAVPHAELAEDRHLDDAVARAGRASPAAPTCSRCRAARARSRMPGTTSWSGSSTTATGPATWSN